MADKYVVIKDTREQEGWVFTTSGSCSGTISEKLDTGDYSIVGYESIFTIERKGSISEFAKNLVQDRFEREMERMQDIKHSYILLEFTMDALINYPKTLKLNYNQKKKIKIRGPLLLKILIEISVKYKPAILFCGSHGKQVADSIFKRIIESEGRTD